MKQGRALVQLVGAFLLAGAALLLALSLVDDGPRQEGLSRAGASSAPSLEAGPQLTTVEGAALAPKPSERAELHVEPSFVGEDLARAAHPTTWFGHVRGRSSKLPLLGATVELRGATERVSVQTDADGAFEIHWSEASSPALEVGAAGFVSQRLPRVDFSQPAEFELEVAAELRVIVSGPTQEELQAAEVSLWDLSIDRRAKRSPTPGVADDEGVYRFEGLDGGEYSVLAVVPGWSLAFEHRVSLDPGGRVELVLKPTRGAVLRGLVRWEQELTPVVGARASFTPARQGVSTTVEELGQRQARTDAEGRFELNGLSTGSGKLLLETDGGERFAARVFIAEPGEELEREFEFLRRGSLAGQVVGPSGMGLAGVELWVLWKDTSPRGMRKAVLNEQPDEGECLRVECDVNGRFLAQGVPAGRRLGLVALRDVGGAAELYGARPVLKLRSAEEREGLEVRLAPTSGATGVVKDFSGAPVAGASVRASLLTRKSAVRWSEARADEDGRFELLGLLPGKYRVDARDEVADEERARFLDGMAELEVLEGVGCEELLIELERASSVSGVVIDEWGMSVPQALVHVTHQPRPDEQRGAARATRADDFGRFELGSLASGAYVLRAAALGFVGEREAARVELGEGDLASGIAIVLKRHEAAERAVVYGRARLKNGGAPIALRLEDMRGGALSQSGESFRVSGLRPGRVRFEFKAKGQLPVRLAPMQVAPGAELDLGELIFERAGDVKVYVKEKGGGPLKGWRARLKGVALEQGGRGSKGVRLSKGKEKHRWGPGLEKVVSEVARSRLVGMGKWELIVERKGFRKARRTIVLNEQKWKKVVTVELVRE